MKFRIVLILPLLILGAILTPTVTLSQIRTYEGSTPDKCTERMVDTTHFPDNRDQMNLQWCHSYVLADLMSFYSQKKISAYGIAAKSYQFWELINTQEGKKTKAFTEWGSIPVDNYNAIAASNEKLCLESNYKPEDGDWNKISHAIDTVKNAPDSICSKSKFELTTGIDEATFKAINKLGKKSFAVAAINLKCTEKQELPFGSFIYHSVASTQTCKHTKTDALSCNNTKHENKIDLSLDKLDDKLSNYEPAIVGYAAKFLTDTERLSYRDYNHVSTVIGRRFNKELNECEYLIRNSWGADCSHYQKKYADKCTDGNIWIPRIDLLKNMDEFYTFDSDKN